MLELLLGLMAQVDETPAPSVTSITVASANDGECQTGTSTPATSASFTVTSVVANSDWANYKLKLYEQTDTGGFTLVATFTGTPLVFTKTMTNKVKDGTVDPLPANKTYRADMVRNSNSQVVSTKTSAQWTTIYGGCDAGGGV